MKKWDARGGPAPHKFGGDYKRKKPDPEAFLIAAERLRVKAEACLVFEDTDMGIEAANAAGMVSVRVPPAWERRGG